MAKDSTDPAIVRARKLFEASGKTLDEVGVGMGFAPAVARKSVWQLLNKIEDPKLSTLRKFCKALGVTLEELVAEKTKGKGGHVS